MNEGDALDIPSAGVPPAWRGSTVPRVPRDGTSRARRGRRALGPGVCGGVGARRGAHPPPAGRCLRLISGAFVCTGLAAPACPCRRL